MTAAALALGVFPVIAGAQEVAATDSAAATDTAATPALSVTPDFAADAWVDANQPIGLRLSRPLDIQNERLAVIVGRTDLAALVTVTPHRARYARNTTPIPDGASE